MAVNKVLYKTKNGTQTLIDLTGDTVTPETLAEGVIAHNAKGEIIIGTAKIVQEPVVTNNLANPNDPNWLINFRYNSSNVKTATNASDNMIVTNVIDVRNVQNYIKAYNLNIKDNAASGTVQGRIYFCDASGNVTGSSGSMLTTQAITVSGNVSTIPKSYLTTNNLQYIRLGGWLTNGAGTSDDVIITIDSEPIMG